MDEIEYERHSGLLWNDLLNVLNNKLFDDSDLQSAWRNFAYQFVEPVLGAARVELVDFSGTWDRQPFVWHLRDTANDSHFEWRNRGGPEAFTSAELRFADGQVFAGEMDGFVQLRNEPLRTIVLPRSWSIEAARQTSIFLHAPIERPPLQPEFGPYRLAVRAGHLRADEVATRSRAFVDFMWAHGAFDQL